MRKANRVIFSRKDRKEHKDYANYAFFAAHNQYFGSSEFLLLRGMLFFDEPFFTLKKIHPLYSFYMF